MRLLKKIFSLSVLFLSFTTVAQTDTVTSSNSLHSLHKVTFRASKKSLYGFDSLGVSPKSPQSNKIIKTSFKSIPEGESDEVEVVLSNHKSLKRDSLFFQIDDERKSKIQYKYRNDSTLSLTLPKSTSDYVVKAIYNGKSVGNLNLAVYPNENKDVIIVPLVDSLFSKINMKTFLDNVYRPANISFSITVQPPFSHPDFNSTTVFDNPGANYDHYTQQMRALRNAYFESNPLAPKNAYYVFVVPSFVNEKVNEFMVRNKAMGFVKYAPDSLLHYSIAKTLARGIGMLQDSWRISNIGDSVSNNLMDTTGGVYLNYRQWELLRHSSGSFSFYDADEDVHTNNGMVAYYFWNEDENGFIQLENGDLLKAIKRPFKKNYLSYHLNIQDLFFKPLLNIGTYFLCIWHIIGFSILGIVLLFSQSKIRKHYRTSLKRSRTWMFVANLLILFTTLFIGIVLFFVINWELEKHEVTSGYLVDLKGQNYENAYKSILYNKNLKRANEDEMSSEILLNKGENWYMKTRKKVLYFELKQDSLNKYTRCRFKSDNDTLIVVTESYREEAASHYFVFNYIDSNGRYERQRIFNHSGSEITGRLHLEEDPAKRILVFVNGYRPTSLGHTFEDNFKDIQKNGLEFPNSTNLIYNFDRYDYWRPWQEFDLKIQKRINPSETFYADGHFSVSTSNYRSLLNFSTVAERYPKRCEDPDNHVCAHTSVGNSKWFNSSKRQTHKLLPLTANRIGFTHRKENGVIAGRNLLQLLNEIPNRSQNDTIIFVAHSMGFAYALGMIEEMRGKINFGDFYIIAPENAESGKVNTKEWQRIWQYGCDHEKLALIAPCMLDGVAPQTKVSDLPTNNQLFIPEKHYRRHGFYDSHFIGFYTWILAIEEGENGFIPQR
jgi:uncharacterized protein YegP (UPF0339 family)